MIPAFGLRLEEQRLDETEVGSGTAISLIDIAKAHSGPWAEDTDPVTLAASLGLKEKAAGLIGWDVFDAVLTPGDLILLLSWKKSKPLLIMRATSNFVMARDSGRSAWCVIMACTIAAKRPNIIPTYNPGRTTDMSQFYKIAESPVGKLKLVANDKVLMAILWEKDNPKRVPLADPIYVTSHPALDEAEQQLHEYFSSKRTRFAIDLDMAGTPFQKRVWDALLAIPFGQTRTYGSIAEELGNANGSRAVGAAVGRNPISIIAPCHRVIGSNGLLTGFAGGIDTKRYLLALERDVGLGGKIDAPAIAGVS
jgi:methylated-DNA-[protein]-cysteine S-methyltransferase